MKILVATTQTQGQRDDDYCWTVDGEIVLGGPQLECCSPDTCGCGRGFPGLSSSRATTTAIVVDRPHIDRAALERAIIDSLERQGWLAGCTDDECVEAAGDEIALIERIAVAFPAGTVIGRSGTIVYPRAGVLQADGR